MGNKSREFMRDLLKPVPWDLHLSEEDLLGGPPTNVLFGRIPFARVLHDLEERGVLAALRRRGYADWIPEVRYPTPFQAHFRLLATHPESPEPCRLMDVQTRFGELPLGGHPVRLLVWEWLSLQDPMAAFPPGVEPLPGQSHPGLGQFRTLMRLMLEYCRELDVEGLAAVPEYFHNAVLYAGTLRFYRPGLEGRFQAMVRDLLPLGLARASRCLGAGEVRDGQDETVQWTPAEQVYGLRPPVQALFDAAYEDTVIKVRESARYRLCSA